MSTNERKVGPKARSLVPSAARVGHALQRLVNLISHRSGLALAVMSRASVTLPQVLLVNHVERRGAASPSEIAKAMHASLPAVSQMIDRLVQQGLLGRAEDPEDRRRKSVTTTERARAFLRKLSAARSTEYEQALEPVHRESLARLLVDLEAVLRELEGPVRRGDPTGGVPTKRRARK